MTFLHNANNIFPALLSKKELIFLEHCVVYVCPILASLSMTVMPFDNNPTPTYKFSTISTNNMAIRGSLRLGRLCRLLLLLAEMMNCDRYWKNMQLFLR